MRGGVETQPLWEEDRGRVGRVGGGQGEEGRVGRVGGMEIFLIYICTMYEW